jgi:lysophospholipase L1-like esterase
VALGDSVAAGLGLPLQSGGNQACKVSYQAYPAYVASALGVPYSNVACSGATAGDLVTEQHLSGTSADISPQLDAAFASGTPSFMTLTAGANDMYWQYFVRKCYSGTCGTPTDQATATQLIRAMQLKLSYAFQSIARRSNGATPTVIITGYYRPFAVNCPPQSAITASEMQWLNAQTDALNYALATTASNYSFVRFVPINFNGHELCSEDPWIQDQNDSAPAHPTAQGQRAIAQAVLGSIQQPARRSGY